MAGTGGEPGERADYRYGPKCLSRSFDGSLWGREAGRYTRPMPEHEPSPAGASGTSGGVAGQGKRQLWEARYRQRDLSEFFWYDAEPPPELRRLMESNGTRSDGAALDLGCGPGHLTVYLSQHMRPAVGVDIAHAAVSQARSLAAERDSDARFAVVEAPDLPFRSGAFGLVFDRGCLQAIPRSSWPKYFREVDRLLRPGGHLWLYCSTVADAPLLSRRGLRLRLRRVLGRKPPRSLSDAILRQLPPSMESVEIEDRRFRTPAGRNRLLVYGLFRKR
jgi:SAM-dependent methyltransferase